MKKLRIRLLAARLVFTWLHDLLPSFASCKILNKPVSFSAMTCQPGRSCCCLSDLIGGKGCQESAPESRMVGPSIEPWCLCASFCFCLFFLQGLTNSFLSNGSMALCRMRPGRGDLRRTSRMACSRRPQCSLGGRKGSGNGGNSEKHSHDCFRWGDTRIWKST